MIPSGWHLRRILFCALALMSSHAWAGTNQGKVALPTKKAGEVDELASRKFSTVDGDLCRLEHCWMSVSPVLAESARDVTKIMERFELYQNAVRAHLSTFEVSFVQPKAVKTEDDDPLPTGKTPVLMTVEEQARLLRSRIALLARYLQECEDLREIGPNEPRDVILVGHSYQYDGNSFRIAAATRKQELIEQNCRSSNPQAAELCRRSITVIEETNKSRFCTYLSLLGTGSVKSFSYIGHGNPDGLVIGQKNLSVPGSWDKDMKVAESEWRLRAEGTLFSQDLKDEQLNCGAELKRVMSPEARIEFLACNTGLGFAQGFKGVTGAKQVFAARTSMYFEIFDPKKKKWLPLGPKNRTPPDARIRLTTRNKDSYGEASDIVGKITMSMDDAKAKSPAFLPRDRISRELAVRLALGAGSYATVEGGKRTLYFSQDESDALRRLIRGEIDRRDLKPTSKLNEAKLYEILQNEAKRAPQKADFFRNLENKLRAVIEESHHNYYETGVIAGG